MFCKFAATPIKEAAETEVSVLMRTIRAGLECFYGVEENKITSKEQDLLRYYKRKGKIK